MDRDHGHGLDWPYDPLPNPWRGVPNWDPLDERGTCDPSQNKAIEHTLFLYDALGEVMPGAHCRVHLRGDAWPTSS